MLVAISEYLLIDSLTLWLLAAVIKILAGLLHCLHCSCGTALSLDDMDSASKIFITSTRSRVIHKNHPSMPSTYWGVLLTFIIIIYTFYSEVCEKSQQKTSYGPKTIGGHLYQLAPIIEGIKFPLIFDSSLCGCI